LESVLKNCLIGFEVLSFSVGAPTQIRSHCSRYSKVASLILTHEVSIPAWPSPFDRARPTLAVLPYLESKITHALVSVLPVGNAGPEHLG